MCCFPRFLSSRFDILPSDLLTQVEIYGRSDYQQHMSDEAQTTKLDFAGELALKRTLLAHQRTLMAWIRTSASMISFGFTIYKFFEYLTTAELIRPAHHLFGPRAFGTGMILVGVVALVLATAEYHHTVNEFQADYGLVLRSAVGKIAALTSVVGIGLLLIVLFRF